MKALSVLLLLPLAAASAAAAADAPVLQEAHAADGEDRLAVIETGSGRIVVEFFADDAPGHVDNFVALAESGFYDGTIFHRVIPGFMIQGGDPTTRQDDPAPRSAWGSGGPGSTIDAEFNDIRHDRGILSMARSADPDSAGSQFFIVHTSSNFLDGQYTAFGRVVTADSLETLDAIALLQTDSRDAPEDVGPAVIESVTIVDRGLVEGVEALGDPARMSAPIGPQPLAPLPEEIPETGTYANPEFGVSFDVPDGWLLQLTGAVGSLMPDMVMMGPAPIGGQPQAITIAVDDRNGTALAQLLDEHARSLDEAIAAGQLEITSRTMITVGGADAQRTEARSDLEFAGEAVTVQFREIIIGGTDAFYTITYSSLAEQFADSEDEYDRVIESFSAAGVGEGWEQADADADADAEQAFMPVLQTPPSNSSGQEPGGGCLIATAAHGTELAPQVQLLREVRDGALAHTPAGSAFLGAFNSVYYAFSPAAADMVREHPAAAHAVRAAMAPLLSILSIMSLADWQSEWQVVALGALAATLAVGAYAAVPAAAAAFAARRPGPRG